MLKKLLYKYYKKELDKKDKLINLLVKEKDNLENNREIRKYVFDIDMLTEKDQKTLGKFHDHEVVKVLQKAFKAKADENCDKMVHFPEESPVKLGQWSLAVRIYDDLVIQLKTLSRLK